MAENETEGTSELVYAKVRVAGVPPDDTRCRAEIKTKKGTSRCKNEIVWDEDGEYWSKFCAKHHAKNELARAEGKPMVVRSEE